MSKINSWQKYEIYLTLSNRLRLHSTIVIRLIGPETRADDIKSDEFNRKNTGKSAGGLRLNELNDYPYII